MNISHFFIDRPIFAAVISIIITLIGAVAYFSLPVAQYPDIAPPSISVTASYPGASAEIVAKTVATPLEQEVNGVDNMLYMTSQSTSDGSMSLAVTFKLGTDLDTAQVLVQNRVSTALPRLPEEVRSIGVTVTKQSPDLMMVIHLSSPDGSRDLLYISNYATLHVKDVLARIDGVGNVTIFGARDYSMRIWLDPEKLALRNLTAGDVVNALRAQNVQVAAGVINQPPVPQPGAFQLNVETQGRLTTRSSSATSSSSRTSEGRVTRVRDVAPRRARRRRLQPQRLSRRAGGHPVGHLPAAGLERARHRCAGAEGDGRSVAVLPSGLRYDIVYNPTVFISQSVDAVIQTMLEAVVLVVVVIILFLQTWRASIIPIVAIPVSLIGTFAMLAALGFSLNNLSLFGLVLAIGIVVDDAIVVVENVERNIREGLSPRDAAYKTMEEVGGALDRHRARAVGRVHPLDLPDRHSRSVLPAVRRDHRHGDSDLADRVADLESGALRAAVQAARSRASGSNIFTRPVIAFFNGFNRAFEWISSRYGKLTGQAGPHLRLHGGDLCRADRSHRLSIHPGADRLHPAAGPGLSDQHHPASARRLAGPHRRGRAQGDQDGAGDARHRPRRADRRPRRRHLHHRAQRRRRVHAA